MYTSVLFARMCYVPSMPGALGNQKWKSDPRSGDQIPELELQIVVIPSGGVWEPNLAPLEEQQVLLNALVFQRIC